jgi:hypothetical protein
MRLRALVLAYLLVALAGARAQGVEVAVPPDRFAGPGEFVTLVYRLTSAEPLEVEIEAETERGWPVLRQPGTVRLEQGRSTPVVVTVEVPVDATALSEERVRLLVTTPSGPLERAVRLTVTERIDLDLQAPREVTLGVEGLRVIATNRGNAADDVVIELRRGADVLGRHALTLEPGAREEIAFALRDDGSHTVVLRSARGAEVRRSVSVLRFGTPDPEPFALAADLTFGADTGGNWRSTFAVKGALSDFAALDARVDAPAWRRSFAELSLAGGSLRIGGGWRDPFGLGLPAVFGVAGALRRDGWGLAAAVGHVADDRFAGVVAASWGRPAVTLAGGAGVAEGEPLLTLRVGHVGEDLRVAATVGHARGALEAGVEVEVRDDRGAGDLELTASGLVAGAGRVDLRARYRSGGETLYGDASWSLDGTVPWGGRVGTNVALVSPLPGELRLGLQAGSSESFGQVIHRADLAEGWRAANGVGLRWDAAGFGVTLDSSWSRLAATYLIADARLTYRPATAVVEGRIGARARLDADAWSLGASGGWDLGRSVDASVGVGWRDGPWRVEAEASLSHVLGGAPDERWSVRASLAGGYAWGLPVGPGVVEASGGRRLGALEGRVSIDGEGLPGVVVEVGRYRVVTDGAGTFRLELPPGRYRWSVVVASVPITVRLLSEALGEAEVRLREVTGVDVLAARTTVLTGRVLEDRDGDGVADEPVRGVAARLLLTDAEGLRRVLMTDADGGFSASGLVPGEAELLLLDVPAGVSVVGEERRMVRLVAGEAAAVEFLVRPIAAVARSFASQALRIRAVIVEAERVPPLAAPLVRVEVQGEAGEVVLESAAGRVPLVRLEGAWVGRVPVPADAPDGLWPFTVFVRGVDAEVSRRGQLLVDAGAAAIALANDGPVRPDGVLRVTLTAYLEAVAVVVSSPFGGATPLREAEPGRWEGALAVPSDAADAVWEIGADVTAADGRVLVTSSRFRVLAP